MGVEAGISQGFTGQLHEVGVVGEEEDLGGFSESGEGAEGVGGAGVVEMD